MLSTSIVVKDHSNFAGLAIVPHPAMPELKIED